MTKQPKSYKYSHKCQNPLCGIEYGTNSKASKTCSDKCRQALNRSKKQAQDNKRLYRFETSPFAHFLARQCLRAETVQVVPNSLELLEELHHVSKLVRKADGYGSTEKYALCHLHPVKGKHAVGTLHPQNLVISSRTLNTVHKNSLPASGIGHSILRCNLEPRWQVSSEYSVKSVISKLVQYLGQDFCQLIAVRLKLQPATRTQYLDKLTPHMDHPMMLAAIEAAGSLDEVKTKHLSKILSVISGKSAGGFFGDEWGMNAGDVFLDECKRLSKYYPHLSEAHDKWLSVHTVLIESGIYDATHYEDLASPEDLAKMAQISKLMFDLFHGSISLKAFYHALDMEVSHSFKEENPPSEGKTAPCLDNHQRSWKLQGSHPECPAFNEKHIGATAPAGNTLQAARHVVDTRVSHSFQKESHSAEESHPLVSGQPYVFTEDDIAFLEELERQQDAISIPEKSLFGVIRQRKTHTARTALQRFIGV